MELFSVSFGCDVALPNVVMGADEFEGAIISENRVHFMAVDSF